jgi:hypothetical protein
MTATFAPTRTEPVTADTTPAQAHRTVTENGKPHYFQDDDPKPELAAEPTTEGDPAAASTIGDPALTPVRGHWFFHDRDGHPYYEESPGVAAPVGPALASVGRHLTVPDSQGVPNYVSDAGVTTGADQASTKADLATDPAAHYLVGDGNGPPENITFTSDPNESDTASLSAVTDVTNCASTTATACDAHHVFGGKDEPVKYVCSRFAPDSAIRQLDDGRVLHREDTDAEVRTDPTLTPTNAHVLWDHNGVKLYVEDPDRFAPPATLQTASDTPNLPQPVILAATSIEQTHAALFTASVWQAITQSGGPRPSTQAHAHLPRMFDPAWLTRLSTPTREVTPEGLSVTLGGGGFERYPDQTAMLAAYQQRPRTWVFENTHHAIPWISLTAAYLGKLSASRLEVVAAVFDSRPYEQAPGAHTDEWYSVIVQFDGAKNWTIGTGPHTQHLTTEPGDVLLIPEALAHATTTPDNPGHSRHLTFALCKTHDLHRGHTGSGRFIAMPDEIERRSPYAYASFWNDPRRPGACKKCGYPESEH